MTGLRAGIVGLGAMGRLHLRVLRELPGVELAGAADPAPLAQSTPGVRVVASVEELLALGIDMCVVAAPTHAHTAIGLRLADAGVHALIEKPVAPSMHDGLLLAEAFESRGLTGCVGHIERYNPAVLAMQDLVLQGVLGTTFQIATRRQGPFPARIRDVGVVMDLAVHDIDLTSWLAGSGYRSVSAVTASPGRREYEDLVSVSGLLCNGVLTSHLVNWLSPVKERVVTVTGDGGSMTANTVTGELWLHRDPVAAAAAGADPGGTFCPVTWHEPIRAELENFRDAILGQFGRIVTIRQGVAAIAVAQAVLTASRSGVAVQPEAAAVAPFALGGFTPSPFPGEPASGTVTRPLAVADQAGR